jgi:hypothetical protein
MNNLNYKIWTNEEDRLLQKLVNGQTSYTEIAKQFVNRSSNSCRLRARRYLDLENKNYVHRLYSYDQNFWSTPNPTNCYWAGFCAADASIIPYAQNKKGYTFCLELSIHDLNHLNELKNAVNYTGVIEVSKDKKLCKFRIHGIEETWKNHLEKNFNIIPRKTKRLFPPFLDDKFLQFCYFIGYIDGDGCICLDKNRRFSVSITSASKTILEWMKNITDQFIGKRKKKRSIQYKNNYAVFRLSGQSAVNLFNYLKDFPVPKLARKWNNPKILNFISQNV